MPTGIDDYIHAANAAGRRGSQTGKRFLQRIFGALSAVLIAAALLGGCAANREPKRFEQTFFDVFDTVTTVILYDTSEKRANSRIDELHALLLDYHRLYDIYHAYDGMNNLNTVNQNAGKAPVPVDGRILDLIEYAKQMETLTNGRMNIAMGSVLTVWQTYRDAGLNDPGHAALPPMDELLAANAHADIESIVIDRAAGTLYLRDANMRLDVGAIAKGYAAQKAVEWMKQSGTTAMLLSIGGNVCSIGARADGTGWKVGIRDPYSDGNLCVAQVSGQSVVTSGTYERFYTVDGKNYHHIIDPATLMPSTLYDSVTVIAEDSGLADALTTGLFCMPLEEGMALVASLPGTEALWVLSDGSQRMSGGFSAYLAQ